MSKFYLKPSTVIVAEMMRRGKTYELNGIGSNDPGPELIGRAWRAVELAKVEAERVFQYPNAAYPFDRHAENEKYVDGFDVYAGFRAMTIINTAPSARFVEEGRPEIVAKNKMLTLPLKLSHAARLEREGARVVRINGKPFLLTRRVAASDGYNIIEKAIRESYAR